MANCAESPAAELADGYSNSGESDWFLPSKDELNQIFAEQIRIGGFSTNYYWSSSEFADSIAWLQDFDFGYQGWSFKTSTAYMRPVRAF